MRISKYVLMLLLIVTFTSCSITSRRYMTGYSVEWNSFTEKKGQTRVIKTEGKTNPSRDYSKNSPTNQTTTVEIKPESGIASYSNKVIFSSNAKKGGKTKPCIRYNTISRLIASVANYENTYKDTLTANSDNKTSKNGLNASLSPKCGALSAITGLLALLLSVEVGYMRNTHTPVLGVFSIVFFIATLILVVISIAKAVAVIKAHNKNPENIPDGSATAGILLSLLGLVFALFCLIIGYVTI